jgi:3-hydroxyacyl-CoA dehydrogenase/3a,7a,12a-trihydroxy-5b-cholest-24-enoyl-CoA hydratase
VINNAGILRDVSMVKMTELDWDLIIKIHMKGTFSVTKAAWNIMR